MPLLRNVHGAFAAFGRGMGISYESVSGYMWLLCGMYMALLRNIPGSFAEYLWPFAESSWLFCGMYTALLLDLVVGWASLLHQFLDICSSFAKYPRLFGGISMIFLRNT